MGYRNYIATITKEEYDKIKDFTKEELYTYKNTSMDDYVGPYDIANNLTTSQKGMLLQQVGNMSMLNLNW